ncbi:MAG: hypothetical protein A2Y23_01145 [Clostridiales bacterium GWB2_37_7]|nr:MAG: hypothetical protein A2Y23_01145 [Clostridiales bacterium GWB2_37_7]
MLDKFKSEIRKLGWQGELYKPHKHVALLAGLKALEREGFLTSRIYFSQLFKDDFSNIFQSLSNNAGNSCRPHTPFFHLHTSLFWKLISKEGKQEELDKVTTIGSAGALDELVECAEVSDEFLEILKNGELKDKLVLYIYSCLRENMKPQISMTESFERMSFPSSDSSFSNPFVSYLNSLQRSGGCNENALAESQACNPQFSSIHVEHPLANIIFDELSGPDDKHIILTGHAGDGKSTLALQVFKRFIGIASGSPLKKPMNAREDMPGVSIFKDLSERNNDQDQDLLNELVHKQRRFLLVTNTGTLLDLIKNNSNHFHDEKITLESKVLDAISTETGEGKLSLGSVEFRVFNLARMDNLGLARQIFEKMINPERWEVCQGRSCKEGCPIYFNIDLILQNQQRTVERIFLAYRRMYEYGTRLTIRQFTEHLAYMITSGLEYADIKMMQQNSQRPLVVEHLFFNRFFGDNGHSADIDASPMKAIQEVARQGFGERPCPMWEHRLWLRSSGKTFDFGVESCKVDFNKLREHGARENSYLGMTPEHAREQVRRMLYFLYDFNKEEQTFLGQYLNSPTLLKWRDWQLYDNQLGFQEKTILEQKIYHVLQEHFTGIRLPEGSTQNDRRLYVTLSRRRTEVRQSAQVVLAQIDWDSIELRLNGFESASGETRYDLMLYGKDRIDGVDLMLKIPFLDYVMMRHFGELGEVLQSSYLERLDRFKAQVQKRAASGADSDRIMLVRLKTDHTFRRQHYAVNNNRLEVTDVL